MWFVGQNLVSRKGKKQSVVSTSSVSVSPSVGP